MSPKRPRKSSLSLISTNWAAKRLTGITLGLLDRRSREVTWRVWSSVHRTSSVNSTEHSGQKSSQVQSLDDRGTRERHWKDAGLYLPTADAYPWVLQFVYNVITRERYETWQHQTQKGDKSLVRREIIIKIPEGRTPCHSYQLYVQQTHHGVLMNLHQSGSNQWLKTYEK